MENIEKCEHQIGVLWNYESTKIATIKDLKEHIEWEKNGDNIRMALFFIQNYILYLTIATKEKTQICIDLNIALFVAKRLIGKQ